MQQDRTEIKVLDKGFVRLDGVHADDLSVVNSARVSFGKHKQELETEDTKLINFLMREQHGTPFEHNFFRFHVKAPIFIAREWFRHRIGWSYNEYSGRYSVINNEYYTPADEDMRTQVGKPGNYTFEQMEEWDTGIAKAVLKRAYYNAFDQYDLLLSKNVAKEIARLVIPVGTYTEFYATTNARALMHFAELRGHKTAQKEIQDYSSAMECFLWDHMPVTYNSFLTNDRKAP